METLQWRLGPSALDHNLPTPETRQNLYDELDFQVGVQGILWAEPAINNALFLRAMKAVGVATLGAMVYDLLNPRQETLTPNQSVAYVYHSINIKDTGPVVHEVPEGPTNARLFDIWMRPVHRSGRTREREIESSSLRPITAVRSLRGISSRRPRRTRSFRLLASR